jgi:hypothetical protein
MERLILRIHDGEGLSNGEAYMMLDELNRLNTELSNTQKVFGGLY